MNILQKQLTSGMARILQTWEETRNGDVSPVSFICVHKCMDGQFEYVRWPDSMSQWDKVWKNLHRRVCYQRKKLQNSKIRLISSWLWLRECMLVCKGRLLGMECSAPTSSFRCSKNHDKLWSGIRHSQLLLVFCSHTRPGSSRWPYWDDRSHI